MEISNEMILGIVIIFGVLLILLIGVLVSFLFSVKKGIDESVKKPKIPELDAEKLIADSSERSVKILEEAHSRARDIIGKADEFLKRDENKLQGTLNETTEVYLKRYESSLNALQLEASKVLENIPKEVSASFTSSLNDFQKNLKEEVKKVEKELTSSISENLKASQDEIKAYKEKRIKELDESLVSIVKEVTKKVLGKDLSAVEHEKLVIKALEEAKRQGIFNA